MYETTVYFERFAKLKETWLHRFLKLPHNPPSDDTFRRIFTALDPKAFVECFTALFADQEALEYGKTKGNQVRHDQTIKDTVRGKRIRAALCEKTLETLLKLNISK